MFYKIKFSTAKQILVLIEYVYYDISESIYAIYFHGANKWMFFNNSVFRSETFKILKNI